MKQRAGLRVIFTQQIQQARKGLLQGHSLFMGGKLFAGIGGRTGLRGHPLLKKRVQLPHIKRFGDMVVHALGQAGVAFFLGCVGGHGDDDETFETAVGPDVPHRRMAVHFRHL